MARRGRGRAAVLAALAVVVLPACRLDPPTAERDPFSFPAGVSQGPAYVSIPFEMGWSVGLVAGFPLVALSYPVSFAFPEDGRVGEAFFRREGGFGERAAAQLAPPTAAAWTFGLVAAAPFWLLSMPVRALWSPAEPEPAVEAPPATPGRPSYLPFESERD